VVIIRFRWALASLLLCCLIAAEPAVPDLAEYRNVEKAVTARITPSQAGKAGQTGYLGAAVLRDGMGRLIVEEVQPASPADKAGLKKGDVVSHAGEQVVNTPEAFREWVQAHGPGAAVKLTLMRDNKPVHVIATLVATSRPLPGPAPRVFLGVQLGEAKVGEGVRVEQVVPGSAAAAAGLKNDDRLLKIDGTDLNRPTRLTELLSNKNPGDILSLTVRRQGKEIELKATLAADRGGRDGPRDGPGTAIWNKPVFRLAVVGIEFADIKHNSKVPLKEWDGALFSKGTYCKTSATGQEVHGSLNDYFQEQSGGGLRLEGKVFAWVEVGKKRGDYVQGSGISNKTAPLIEALDKLAARDGKDALKSFDGLLFLYAGERVPTHRGALYYPHAGSVFSQGRRTPYLLGAEGGPKISSISAFVKEFGQVLGLPDLAARTENIGSEGLGVWCAISSPLGNGRPQHFCAWSKESLGWLKPAVIDPTVKQKLILSPIEDSPKECFKVLVRPDGSEYFLLENRRKKGFDTDLPGEGLLIWRVVNDRPILEEAHGVEGPLGPTMHLNAVPYPNPANHAFTPETTPSSRSPRGGGLPVHITEIRRLGDGRIAFQIGFEYR